MGRDVGSSMDKMADLSDKDREMMGLPPKETQIVNTAKLIKGGARFVRTTDAKTGETQVGERLEVTAKQVEDARLIMKWEKDPEIQKRKSTFDGLVATYEKALDELELALNSKEYNVIQYRWKDLRERRSYKDERFREELTGNLPDRMREGYSRLEENVPPRFEEELLGEIKSRIRDLSIREGLLRGRYLREVKGAVNL